MYFVARELWRQWNQLGQQPLDTTLEPWSIAASALLVLGTYALLVQLWRLLVASSGASLRFWPAVRIWAVSGLFRYVPGKVWSIGAMAALASRESVPAIPAASSAVLNTILNLASGIAISMLLAWRWLNQISPNAQPVSVALLVAAALGLIALPYALPRLGTLAGRLTGRDIVLRAPPPWALGLAIAGNMLAWALYGLAFMWLARGVLGTATGQSWQYIAVFTASYIVGYLFLIIPGGIGPREAMMTLLMTSLGLSSAREAVYLAVVSRVWLTILETVPGFLFLAYGAVRGRPNPLPPDVPKTG